MSHFIPDQQGSKPEVLPICYRQADAADKFCFTFNCDDRGI